MPMDFIEALKIILFGIIEGITEWLPVSSTGHLILFHKFIPTSFSSAFLDMFEYVIQLSAIFAVIVVFWKRVCPIGLKNKGEQGEDKKKTLYWKKDSLTIWGKVLLACVPALFALVIDKLLLEKVNELTETIMIASALIVYGVAFILVEKFYKVKNKTVSDVVQISWKNAFFIGCFQILAVIPGTSRSGVTILGALLLCVSRTAAAEFTFFLAIPTMVGTSGYKILSFFMDGNTLGGTEWFALLIGCLVAFGVSLLAIQFLMDFVKKHTFKPFGWYRIGLGVVVLVVLVVIPLLR
ncbi:MAG: undecaprenyl-diphosphate phosphatase [Clostridiales bacterium]|nr:undecaprenyl-diphosphate phosphatase [Clostridiales bacterium]